MRNRALFHIIISLLILATLTSCKKETLQLTIAKQEEDIEKFINSKYEENEVIRKGGSNRIIIEKQEDADVFLEKGDSVYLYYAGYIFTNSPSSIFTTNVKEIAENTGLNLTGSNFEVSKILYNKSNFIPGLYNGLDSVSTKEHSLIVFSSKYGFGNEVVYNIPKMSALIYEIWVDKIIKKQ